MSQWRAGAIKWLDGFALSASALCMVHCLALPLLLAVLPALTSRFSGPWFHIVMLMVAIPTSVIALVGGFRRHHLLWPLFLGATGLTLMAGGVMFEGRFIVETGMTVFGSAMLASAHIMNWRNRTVAAQSGLEHRAACSHAEGISHARLNDVIL